MNCPACNVALTMTERQGVEIDYCPKCRGVWLDRGELDKIIDRSAGNPPPPTPTKPYYESRDRYSDSDDYSYKKKKKKESFLGELFDF